MKNILVMDAHDYDDGLEELRRVAIRGIIFIDDKLLMIEDSFGNVRLPGGGMEPGETDRKTLMREVREETGYNVVYESIKPFGEIEEKRLSVHEQKIWHQINRLYFCEVYPVQETCEYSENERKQASHPLLCTIEDALEKYADLRKETEQQTINQREYKTLLLLKEHIDQIKRTTG